MVGIHLPPDPALALRNTDPQGLKSALSVAKLAALMPAGAVTETVAPADSGATVQQNRPGIVTGGTPNPADGAAPASARETFSSAARVILDILEGTEPAPLRGSAPLLPSAPAPGSTGALAAALAQQVGQSGLFYESHLGQWVNGTQPLDALMREPQAALGPGPAAPASAPAPGADDGAPVLQLTYQPAPVAPPTAAQAAAADARAVAAATVAIVAQPDTQAPADDAPPPAANPANAASHAAQSSAPPATSGLPVPQGPSAHLAQQATQAYQAASAPLPQARHVDADGVVADGRGGDARLGAASATPAAGPAVHPDAAALVRQQLDTLATQQFRWIGEAWPGTPLDWQIRRETEERHAGGHGQAPDPARAPWSTKLVLQFPHLGTVEARLSVAGNRIEARLAAPDSVNRLHAARAQLQERLAATGLDLSALAVNGILSPGENLP
ncbi:flagellar hook-length control protein FliK [Cupriavidus basilensis]|uniref:flagellar hook-length control protein FliK n=1 Tax=Cupriavidus basilensis TaxID=68895 RepID=UPI0007507D0C|nr:flagellar hook-length control protein FliK [Cupriavidus basilensis]